MVNASLALCGEEHLEILVAGTAGFCMGVRRALNMAMQAANDPASPLPIKTVGSLIHNDQVLQLLEEKGVGMLKDVEHETAGTAIIRAHGVSPELRRKLKQHCERVVDATCPHVGKVQRIVAEYAARGYLCIVVGDRGHAEVEAVISCAQGLGHIVGGVEDVESLPQADRAAVVAQTTQDSVMFQEVTRKLRARYRHCEVFDTICRSTDQRQAEARDLAARVDAMVVVGGYHSANTGRLAHICAATGTPTFHVETDEQLEIGRLSKFHRVGISAGASTPLWMIRRVAERLRTECDGPRTAVGRRLYRLLDAFVYTNLFLGGGAALLTLVNSLLMDIRPLPACMALAFFFVVAQHLCNQAWGGRAVYLDAPRKEDFFQANERFLRWTGLCLQVAALLISLYIGWGVFMLVLLGSAGGVLYRFRLGRGVGRSIGIQSLQQLPGSKELFVSVAWSVATALVPAMAAGVLTDRWQALILAMGFTFLLTFQRTVIRDFLEVEGDRLMGRDTVVIAFGEARSKRLFHFSLAAELVLLVVVGWALGGASPLLCLLLLLHIPYAVLYFALFEAGRLPAAELGEMLLDGAFYVPGVAALVWWAAQAAWG